MLKLLVRTMIVVIVVIGASWAIGLMAKAPGIMSIIIVVAAIATYMIKDYKGE